MSQSSCSKILMFEYMQNILYKMFVQSVIINFILYTLMR